MDASIDKAFVWGLVGIGRHADRFVAPAIQASTTGRLLAVCSRDRERARQFADRHGAPSAYDSLDALLEDTHIHAVFVCSPNDMHREHVLRAAQSGKHVLCEKPLATTVEDSRSMIEACRQAGVGLGVGFNMRHNPAHERVKELVAAGAIGDLRMARVEYMHKTGGAEATRKAADWRRDPRLAGGGSFMGTGVHAVDLLRFLLGKEITHVQALADASWHVSGLERLIEVSLRLEGDAIASISSGQIGYPTNELVLYGTSGTLRCSGSIGYHVGGLIELLSAEGSRTIDLGPCDPYAREVDSFAASVLAGKEPNASGEDGLRVVAVTTGIYESLGTGRLVALRIEESL